MEDSKIIELFNERSQQAIVELSKKYGKLCHSVALNILGNECDAQECVNDAYLGVWNKIPPTKPASLMAFVCGVTRNIATARYHASKAQKRDNSYDEVLDELEMLLPDEMSVEESIEAKELTALFEEFLQKAGDLDRAIFIRRYWFSQSASEIGKYLGKSSHYISVRLSRIKNDFKKFLLQKGIKL